jgi:hypothetical protein
MPIVDPTKAPNLEVRENAPENPNPDCCKKHCHYPTVQTGRYSAGGGVAEGCMCMENRRDCEFEWVGSGRGFCVNCHHGSSLTVKDSDCTLDF